MLDNEFPPLGGGQGIANYYLLKHLAEDPHYEIDLITAALGSSYERATFSSRVRIFKVPIRNRNIHHSSCRELVEYYVRSFLLTRNLIRNNEYDVCLAWSTVPAGATAFVFRFLARLPYIIWVSGPDIPGFERRYRFLYPLLRTLIGRVWRRSHAVIAKCQGEIDLIKNIDQLTRVELIHNAVDLSEYHDKPDLSDSGPLKLINVGRLIERKGQIYILQALKMLLDDGIPVQLTLVGFGDLHERYVDLAKCLGIENHVIFTGAVDHLKVREFLADSHIFVLPSYNEGLSFAALEALATGLPLILTDTGGTKELLSTGEENGFLVPWADAEAIADCVKLLAADRPRLTRMGRASRAHAENFSWQKAVCEFKRLLEGAALQRKAGR